jgi:hypothetical protein
MLNKNLVVKDSIHHSNLTDGFHMIYHKTETVKHVFWKFRVGKVFWEWITNDH